MGIRGIILAGGLSSRMGKNKLKVELNGKAIIERVFENVKASKLRDIIVVCGKYEVETDLPKVLNSRYAEGMSTSIIAGMENYKGNGVMIILGDMPFIEATLINELMDRFELSEKNIVIPRYDGKKGNPVIIGSKYFKDLLANQGDKGAREIIKTNSGDIEWVEVLNDSILIDIDDAESLLNYELRYWEGAEWLV